MEMTPRSRWQASEKGTGNLTGHSLRVSDALRTGARTPHPLAKIKVVLSRMQRAQRGKML